MFSRRPAKFCGVVSRTVTRRISEMSQPNVNNHIFNFFSSKIFLVFSINFIDNTYNIWKDVRLVLESDVTNVVFEGERGGAHYNDDRGDIALDDVFVVEGNCSTDDCKIFCIPYSHFFVLYLPLVTF